MKHLYNIYDRENRLIGKNKTSAQIAQLFGIDQKYVTSSIRRRQWVHGRYRLEVACEDKIGREVRELLETWEDVVKPFRNVIWVEQPGIGVKRLGGKRA